VGSRQEQPRKPDNIGTDDNPCIPHGTVFRPFLHYYQWSYIENVGTDDNPCIPHGRVFRPFLHYYQWLYIENVGTDDNPCHHQGTALFAVILAIPFSAANSMLCAVKTSCTTSEFEVFDMQATTNSHAGQSGTYSNKVCHCCPK
jgi:hypothetical protein